MSYSPAEEPSTEPDLDRIFTRLLSVQTKKATRQDSMLQMRSGRCVGTGTCENVREEVLLVMDLLHMLWCITNPDFDVEYPVVQAFPPESSIPPAMFPRTLAAMKRLYEEPVIQREVGAFLLNISLSHNVGRKETNHKADVLLLQNVLYALRFMTDDAYTAERLLVLALSSPTILGVLIPHTLAAITRLRVAIVSGTLGWTALHTAEHEYNGSRFGIQTYWHNTYVIFVPRGAKIGSNKVHVFFAAHGFEDDSGYNDLLASGLRSVSDHSEWITIAVPGSVSGLSSISGAAVGDCLASVGRSPAIVALRITAQDRGVHNLEYVLSRNLIPISLIEKVFTMDTYHPGLARTIKSCNIPTTRVTAYSVNTDIFPLSGSCNIFLSENGLRAIIYSRLIQNAQEVEPTLVVPKEILLQLLPLPPRGKFTSGSVVDEGQVNIVEYCRENEAAITRMIGQEDHPMVGCKTFIEKNDLAHFKKSEAGGYYTHHFFLSEIVHEIFA